MQRLVIQTKIFSEILDDLLRKKQPLLKDYEELEKSLVEHPKQGDVIPGLSGLRKVRLKSSYFWKAWRVSCRLFGYPQGRGTLPHCCLS